MQGKLLLRTFVVVLALASACRRSAPDAPGPVHTVPGTLEVLKDGRWLFTYVEPSGTFTTTDKPEAIPARSRAVVRVFDPSNGAQKNAEGGEIYIADVNALL